MKKQRRRLGVSLRRFIYFILIFLAVVIAFVFVPVVFYASSLISADTLNFASNAAISLSFPASAFVYLGFIDKKKKKSVIQRLGLGAESLTVTNLLLGVLIFLIIFALEITVGLISSISGVQINSNVDTFFVGAPLWFYLFASIISPIDEEILFRGLGVPALGVVVSAAVFGLLHYSYGSTYGIEMIAAFIFGLVTGYVYKKTGSLYPSILAHILVNALTVIVTLSILW